MKRSTKKKPPTLTKVDLDLLARGLNTLLWAERETCVSVARDLYVVADAEGKAKRFDGDWKALREWAASLPAKEMPLGITAYDRLEQEVNTLRKKLVER